MQDSCPFAVPIRARERAVHAHACACAISAHSGLTLHRARPPSSFSSLRISFSSAHSLHFRHAHPVLEASGNFGVVPGERARPPSSFSAHTSMCSFTPHSHSVLIPCPPHALMCSTPDPLSGHPSCSSSSCPFHYHWRGRCRPGITPVPESHPGIGRCTPVSLWYCPPPLPYPLSHFTMVTLSG